MAETLLVDMPGLFVSHYSNVWESASGGGRRDSLFLLTGNGSVTEIWCPETTYGALGALKSKLGDRVVASVEITHFPASRDRAASQSVRLVHVEAVRDVPVPAKA